MFSVTTKGASSESQGQAAGSTQNHLHIAAISQDRNREVTSEDTTSLLPKWCSNVAQTIWKMTYFKIRKQMIICTYFSPLEQQSTLVLCLIMHRIWGSNQLLVWPAEAHGRLVKQDYKQRVRHRKWARVDSGKKPWSLATDIVWGVELSRPCLCGT